MASNLLAMASTLIPMASNLEGMTSNLRTHLVVTLLRELQRRLLKLMSSADQDPIRCTLVKNGILLEDQTWPYMQWDSREKRLILKKSKTPMSMTMAQEMLEELLALVKEDGAIQKFHSLQAGTGSQPALETVGWPENRSTLPTSGQQLQFESMADRGDSAQGAFPESVPPGFSQGHDAAAVRDGEQGMVASNPANHCFVNASVLALVWASLHRFHFSMADWGLLQDGLKAMLQKGSEPFLILGIEQFGQLFAQWDGTQQCDAVEFTSQLLAKLDQTVVHSLWERRYLREKQGW